MKTTSTLIALLVMLGGAEAIVAQDANIRLPPPQRDGTVSVERALAQRRSTREFQQAPITVEQLSQLLWAAQGVTGPAGQRTAPSAGALYPLEIYVAVGQVTGLATGIYKYRPRPHELIRIAEKDARAQLATAAVQQDWIAGAPAIFVIAAVEARTTHKYGPRGQRYVLTEVGHAGENLCLQAVALELGTTVVGAFTDEAVWKLMGMTDEERPWLMIPVGHPRRER